MNTMREKQVEEVVLRMDTMYGELDSLLFVGKYEEGWGCLGKIRRMAMP